MIEYHMALASASSNTKPVGMCTQPYLLPSWTLLKPSLCIQVDRDVNSCGVNITIDPTVEEPLVHKDSVEDLLHDNIVALLSYYYRELDASPNHGRRWLVLLVATQSKDKTLLLKSKGRDPVLSRVSINKLTNNVNTTFPGVQSKIDAGWSGKFTQLTMEVIMKHKQQILHNFSTAGIPVYLVGGSIRDMLMKKDSKDIDLATPCSPTEMKVLLSNQPWCLDVYDTGLDHGTISIMWHDGFGHKELIEITQFRVDTECDGRHAKVVPTTSIEEDLARRDLTVNAIAFDGENLIDPFNGARDIEERVLRCVGTPMLRFQEDELRVLRLFRFEAKLGFDIHPDTLKAALECGVGRKVSIERIIQEIDSVFSYKDADCMTFLDRLRECGVLKRCLPELWVDGVFCDTMAQSPTHHPEGDVWTHIKLSVQAAEGVAMRWMALLHDIAKPITAAPKPGTDYMSFHKHDTIGAEMIPDIGKRLRLPNKLVNKIAKCTKWHLKIYLWSTNGDPKPKHVRRVQADMGDDLMLLKYLAEADHMGRPLTPGVDKFFERLEEPVTRILTGAELIKRGHKPGSHFGVMLKRAFDYQIETGETNMDTLYNVSQGDK